MCEGYVRVCEQVEDLFDVWRRNKGSPVAAAIVEPIQAEGGKYERYRTEGLRQRGVHGIKDLLSLR